MSKYSEYSTDDALILRVVQLELDGMREILKDALKRPRPNNKHQDVAAAARNSVAAFEKLAADPDERLSWWASISAEGRKLILSTLD